MEKKDRQEDLLRAGIAGASYEKVQRYGSAAKQHLNAYDGELQKNLKGIKAQKVNEQYAYSIKQQKAGWAAEVKETANANAEKIINGDLTRKIRHDDLANTPANHPLYDHVEIDAAGNVIEGSGTQMKFIGGSEGDPGGIGNAERALKKLQSPKFQKYIDNDVPIEVPKDEYGKMINRASEELDSLNKQLERAKVDGNVENITKLEKKIDNLNKLKKNLKPSSVTRKEAIEAANHPIISTAKSVTKISHRAGVSTAESAAVIGGSVSLVKNVVAMCKGEIEAKEALGNVAKDTAESAVVGYGTGFAGSAIKGTLEEVAEKTSSELVGNIAKSNLPGTIVAMTVSASKTLKRYIDGDIDGVQCLEDLGEQGTGMIASSMFAVVGQMAIPIPVVGGLIGGMVGYALSSATYGVLISSLKEAKLAHEERIEIEKVCDEHIKMIREYRKQMNEIIEQYLSGMMSVFIDSFNGIKDAFEIGDVDLFVENANKITETLGGNKPFETMDDFNEKMFNGLTFKL